MLVDIQALLGMETICCSRVFRKADFVTTKKQKQTRHEQVVHHAASCWQASEAIAV